MDERDEVLNYQLMYKMYECNTQTEIPANE